MYWQKFDTVVNTDYDDFMTRYIVWFDARPGITYKQRQAYTHTQKERV